MAALTLAPLRPDGTEPGVEGIRVWFEPPRHGWLFPHIDLIGHGEFVCRASDVENDFLADLVAALQNVLGGSGPTVAVAFGEPQSFDFRFARNEGEHIRCDLVTYNRFVEPLVEEPILSLSGNGDGICRAFCFGLRELLRTAPAEVYAASYSHTFPTAALATLCATLGGEFAETP